MAKFYELSEENLDLVQEMFQNTGLYNYMDIKILGISKAKEIVKIARTNPLAEYVGNCPDSVTCIIYEEAFDRLDEKTRRLILEDAFATLSYDSEKDKIIVGCPSLTVTLAGRAKYGEELINALETGVLAIQQIEDEKKAIKEAEKAAKAARKQNK